MSWRTFSQGCVNFLAGNWLSLFMLSAIIVGFLLGVVLKVVSAYDNREIMYIGFLGEIFLKLLMGVAVPMMASCIIISFATLDAKLAKTCGVQLTVFILVTKVLAVAVAIAFAMIIRPGSSGKKEELESHSKSDLYMRREVIDNFLDMMRNIIPNNLIALTMRQSITNITKDQQGKDQFEEVMLEGVNMLGLVTFSIVAGIVLKIMGVPATPLIDVINVFCQITFVIVKFIMYVAPFLLISLVAQQIVVVDPTSFLSSIGLYAVTATSANLFFFFVVYPLIILFLGKRNPFKIYLGYLEAITTAFASSSSMVSIPVAINILHKKCGYNAHLVAFIVPLSIAISKDGACINIATASIFLAQYDGMHIDVSTMLMVAILSIFLSVAGPAVPQAILVVIIVMLNALDLPTKYASSIIAVDLVVDRFCTTVTVTGACVAVAVISNYMKKDMERQEEDDNSSI